MSNKNHSFMRHNIKFDSSTGRDVSRILPLLKPLSVNCVVNCVVICALLTVCPAVVAQQLEQLNVDSNDVSRSSSSPFISSNGRYVVFVSSFLLSSDTFANQVYLYDRETERIELVSQTASGSNANASTSLPNYSGARAVTEDGRFVVFASAATNLPDTTNPSNLLHIWIRDRELGTTSLVSRDSAGNAANARSWDFSVAPNAGDVIFNSSASNLDANDPDGAINTFLHQMNGRTTRLACFNSLGAKVNTCREMSLSCNGGMAFLSSDDEINLNDLNPGIDVFFGPPLGTGANNHRILSTTALGGSGNNINYTSPAVSCDGNRIAFGTRAQLSLADTDSDWDLYVYGLNVGIAELVRGPSNQSLRPLEVAISASGNFIAVETQERVDPSDSDNFRDVILAPYSEERRLGELTLISQRNGVKGNRNSIDMSVSDTGAVVFSSSAPNLVDPGQASGNDILLNSAAEPEEPTQTVDPALILLILNGNNQDEM